MKRFVLRMIVVILGCAPATAAELKLSPDPAADAFPVGINVVTKIDANISPGCHHRCEAQEDICGRKLLGF